MDGSEAYAKRAASQISKKLKSFPGLTSVDVEYSGSPPGMSGGAVFGIIFLVATIVAISGFVYIKDWFIKFCIQKMMVLKLLSGCNSLKTHNSVIALETLLVARSKTKTITVVAMMETQLMLFHQWNQLLKQLKLPRLCQPQLQPEKSKRELNHQVISKIKTINHQGRSHSIYHHRFPYCLWPVIDKDTE